MGIIHPSVGKRWPLILFKKGNDAFDRAFNFAVRLLHQLIGFVPFYLDRGGDHPQLPTAGVGRVIASESDTCFFLSMANLLQMGQHISTDLVSIPGGENQQNITGVKMM